MKRGVVLLLCVIAAAMNSFAQYNQVIPESYGFKVKIGETVPDFTLETPDGKKTTMKELRGKIVMLQFTASWCPVCRKEMPHIEKDIWLKHKDNKDFALYGIDLKEDKKTTEKFHKDMKITYPLALDVDGKIFSAFTVENAGVTRNIIIDKKGKIAYMTRLFKMDEFNEMKKVIDNLLEE